jgi:hypothetical protein
MTLTLQQPARIPRSNAKPRSKMFKVSKMMMVFGGYMNECLWCADVFDSSRPAKYCQEVCRTRAYQARQRRILKRVRG